MDDIAALFEGLAEAQALVDRQGSTGAQAALQFAIDWLSFDEDDVRLHFQLKDEVM